MQDLDGGGGAIPEHTSVHGGGGILPDHVVVVEIVRSLLRLLECEYLHLTPSHLRCVDDAVSIQTAAVCRRSYVVCDFNC